MAPIANKITVEELANSVNKQRDEKQSATTIQNATSSTNATQPETTATTTEKINKYGLEDDKYMSGDVTTRSSSGSRNWWLVGGLLSGAIVSAAIILSPWNIGQWIIGIPVTLLMIVCFLIFGFDAFIDDEFTELDVVLYVLTIVNIIFMNIWKTGYSTIGFVASIGLVVSSLFVMARAYYEMEAKQGHWALLCLLINIAVIFWDKVYFYIEQLLSYVKGF